jgi:hypothetical protein
MNRIFGGRVVCANRFRAPFANASVPAAAVRSI